MSWQPCEGPDCGPESPTGTVELVIVPRARDIGDFEVRRALPARERQMVGPFIFFDQMGPAEFLTGKGIDVRPHPHIGLATVTYLFRGEIFHRDSLGTAQAIRPGAVNWMSAGRGIVHSERTAPEERAQPRHALYGIQTWVALPTSAEDSSPGFVHHGAEALPIIEVDRGYLRVIAGSFGGARSPLATPTETLYVDLALDRDARLSIPADHDERAIYVVEGGLEIGHDTFNAGTLLVLHKSAPVTIRATAPTRALLFGGEPMDGPRHIWWNFVSSSREKLEAAKADWLARRFPIVPGDESEFIPLPGA